jgi:protein-tyrosine phosphatase
VSFKRIAGPLLLAAVVGVAACNKGQDSLAPEQRYIPSELPVTARAGFRQLPLQGAPNFRDLGGYTTADGRVVRWGKLYRTDALNELTDDDQRYLERLGIQRIVDFRIPDEAGEARDKLPDSLRGHYVNMPVGFNDGNYAEFIRKIMSGDTQGLNLQGALEQGNIKFVREFTPVFRDWLHGLVGTADGAQVFHCTAGKDRTGLASALFLLALGVPEDQVMQDYLASNVYLKDKNEKSLWKMRIFSFGRADTEGVKPMMEVRRSYLQAAFDTMRQDYGSIDNYLRDGLGVDDAFREQLRARYLEPAQG